MQLTPTQTKAVAIATFVILIPLELLLFATMISTLVGDGEDKAQAAFMFVFVMAIFFLPIRWAYSIWKGLKSRSEGVSQVTPATAEALIKIQTKIELPEYRKLMFQLSYTSSLLIYLHIIGIGIFTSYLFNGTGEWLAYFSIIFLLYLPIVVYRSAATNYKTTKAIHETLLYEFTTETISATGETFNTVMQWTTFHKVRETKVWFLLYTNRQVAMLIPKRAFATQQEIDLFRELTKKIGI